MPALLVFTGLLMAGGGFVVWDMASAVSRAAQLATAAKASDVPDGAASGTTRSARSWRASRKMLATIEQQTDEINQFPRRLDQLARQAFRDPLTGLPNRALFVDRLAHALTRTERRGEQLAVLFLDLDRFKVDQRQPRPQRRAISSSSGSASGWPSCLRPEDTIARLGGDEFAILLEDVKDDKAP